MKEEKFSPSWQSLLYASTISKISSPLYASIIIFFLATLLYSMAGLFTKALPLWRFEAVNIQSSFWLAFVFYFWGHVNRFSETALDEIQNELRFTKNEFALSKLQFQMISARAGWVATGIAVVFLIGGFFFFPTLYSSNALNYPIYGFTVFAINTVVYSLAAAFFGLVIKKIRMIETFLSAVPTIDLFDHAWLDAFSRLTLIMSAPFMLANLLTYYINVLLNPDFAAAVFFFGLNSLMATFIFVSPLLGIHSRLVDEKRRLKKMVDSNVSSTISSLNKLIADKKSGGTNALKDNLSTLREMEEVIDKSSTWPWESNTLRNFVSALVLPVALWFIQGVLSRFISF